MSYSRFIAGLRLAEIEVDRKVLADLAVTDARGVRRPGPGRHRGLGQGERLNHIRGPTAPASQGCERLRRLVEGAAVRPPRSGRS